MNDERTHGAEHDHAAPSLFEEHHETSDDLDEPGEHGSRARRRGRGPLSCLIVLVVLALLGGGAYALVSVGMDRVDALFQGPEDYTGEGTKPVVFEVKEGDTSAAIGRNLKAAGVVASVEAFTEAAANNPDSRSIQVGFYELRKKLPAEAALEILVDPGNLVQNTVTIPEGLRVEDTLAVLSEKTDIPVEEFEQAVEKSGAIGLPSYANGNAEGYLFPATYAFAPNADATEMLSAMVDRWRQAAEEADLEARAEELGYRPGEVMIVASLVESEANRDEDRGKVARVIYNRLETDATNGLLQIDATVNYALGRDLGLALDSEDLQVNSPYNTRRYPGLPPGPIESPGDEAIEAAVNPTPGDWVYYVTVNLDTGETKFTEDYDEFLRFKNVELEAFCDSSDRC